jgi:hypothetical protein
VTVQTEVSAVSIEIEGPPTGSASGRVTFLLSLLGDEDDCRRQGEENHENQDLQVDLCSHSETFLADVFISSPQASRPFKWASRLGNLYIHNTL